MLIIKILHKVWEFPYLWCKNHSLVNIKMIKTLKAKIYKNE